MEVALVRSDGALRQYHHAVTPVLDENGQVDHVLKLTLDVTDQTKKVYQLSRLRQIGELMQGVLDLDRLLHFVLTCVTAGQALGFNRALLFLVDKDRNVLEGKMGVGPASAEEAGRIWSQITREAPTLEDLLARYDRAVPRTPSMLDQLARGICIPLSDTSHIAVACAFGRRPIIVSRPFEDPRVSEDFRRLLGSREFVLAPLIARGEPVGVILADNLFSGQPISEEHVELLSMFANQAAIAIENAGNYRRLQEEKMHLEAAYRDLARRRTSSSGPSGSGRSAAWPRTSRTKSATRSSPSAGSPTRCWSIPTRPRKMSSATSRSSSARCAAWRTSSRASWISRARPSRCSARAPWSR